jgi:hypothetical protein
MLILIPAPRALDLLFPFAIVEGKSYSTGKQIFEAENQAASLERVRSRSSLI